MKFHYEFDDIHQIEHVYYQITLPALIGARWISHINHVLMSKTNIKIYHNNNLVQDVTIYPEERIIYDLLNYDPRCSSYIKELDSHYPNVLITKLSCVQIKNIFGYLQSPIWTNYKVVVDVDIITEITPIGKYVIGDNPVISGNIEVIDNFCHI